MNRPYRIEEYERVLRIVHLMDDISDEFGDLFEILRNCLNGLSNELNCDSAFVTYEDLYGAMKAVAVDRHGFIKRSLHGEAEKLDAVLRQRSSEESLVEDRLLEGKYLLTPMRMKKKFVGSLGIQRESGLTETDEFILREAAKILDSVIVQRCREQLYQDRNRIVQEIDQIVDEHSEDMPKCMGLIIDELVQATGATTGFIFGQAEDEFEVQATDSTGRIVWENYETVRHRIMNLVQDCVHKQQAQTVNLETDIEEMRIAGRCTKGLLGFPLQTSTGESAGIIVLLGELPFSPGHGELVGAAAAVIDTAIIKERHIKLMVSRFSKHVGTDLMDTLLRNPEWLDPRREEVVILSADLVGSTAYAHQEPDALRVFEMVNEYLGLIGKIVKEQHGGTLDKYIGDEVMGIFGAPVRDVGAPENAAECAICIRDTIRQFNKNRSEAVFQVKITLGFVDAIAGEVGSEDTQTDYTVIGDGVNQFFRIAKHHAQADKIIINDELSKRLQASYVTRSLEKVEVKGIPEPIPIHELLQRVAPTEAAGTEIVAREVWVEYPQAALPVATFPLPTDEEDDSTVKYNIRLTETSGSRPSGAYLTVGGLGETVDLTSLRSGAVDSLIVARRVAKQQQPPTAPSIYIWTSNRHVSGPRSDRSGHGVVTYLEDQGSFAVEDLDTTNGTLHSPGESGQSGGTQIRGKGPVPLEDGQVVLVGGRRGIRITFYRGDRIS